MGRLIDCDNAYNAIQITSDKFGVASMVVFRTVSNMLSQIPTVDAIRIPENATNGDALKAVFPSIESRLDERTGITLVKWVDGTTKTYKTSWWNAPYKGRDTRYAVLYANDKPIVCEPLPAQCQSEECEE